ncbi:tRNA (adenosine(37)-N6)-threonylcarbamoyltransferase complex dimerization subunit type 1 TsaB [Irregularibacter muris]|uniref:tRNA (Adenosine(37)-N6)-threonylcarbamoyltransferase complex dimerization subunit type 1 TsaB n=1 Tax=Irregularibacter muris TaxID=1796619 RepID=A0AAE3HEC4_9FIRM|nr:tRNA (adenosine(37)-N6)-threonylcarbamoyltransferase complex dimerization subunit type 1 TsaB [Irregularibacter muris]MCR1898902.1 tRNA (adenosine(37)-N6)-threonylcarbamoyltransferase complex dimerization subunit type 1 TsaB [Irregularibacter muris]
MKVLALDTSSIVATAALVDEDRVIGEMIINHKKNHSEKLMPIIQNLLEEVEVEIKEIDAFGVCIGPGSFTGLRIGMATAKALAQVADKPMVGISTLEALAYNLPFSQGSICPILDAQRNQIYTGLYQWKNKELIALEKDQAIGAEEWIEKLKDREKPIILVGDGVAKFGALFQENLQGKIMIAPPPVRMPRASSIGSLALQRVQEGKAQHFKDISPQYLRKSQAEQNLHNR